ncbi:MAG TPA: hypothetical protein PL004_10185 [Bacillota bacterium]|nr:hypothetical protein [Bacillota bacterium]
MPSFSHRTKKYGKNGLQGNLEYQNSLMAVENRDDEEERLEPESELSTKVVSEAEEAADLGTFDSI